jgi:hypothetical protein
MKPPGAKMINAAVPAERIIPFRACREVEGVAMSLLGLVTREADLCAPWPGGGGCDLIRHKKGQPKPPLLKFFEA